MAEEKRYFWLKLKDDFFDQKHIRALRKLPSGNELVIIYMKMMLKSMNNNGVLEYDCILPAYESEIALAIDEDEHTVKSCVEALLTMNIAELFENNDISLTEVTEMIGSESASARRQQKSRASKNSDSPDNGKVALQCHTDVTDCHANVTNSHTEKRREREDIDNIRDREECDTPDGDTANRGGVPSPTPKETKHKYGSYNNVLFTDSELEKLKSEFPNDLSERIERLSEYIASTGKKYKSHLATIRSWAKNDKTTVHKNQQPDYSDVNRYKNLKME